MFADELAKVEVKFKEQLKTNENLKLQLAAEEDRYKVSIAGVQTLSAAQAVSCQPYSATFAVGRFLDSSRFYHSVWLV